LLSLLCCLFGYKHAQLPIMAILFGDGRPAFGNLLVRLEAKRVAIYSPPLIQPCPRLCQGLARLESQHYLAEEYFEGIKEN
jgi:hypothetical protein